MFRRFPPEIFNTFSSVALTPHSLIFKTTNNTKNYKIPNQTYTQYTKHKTVDKFDN